MASKKILSANIAAAETVRLIKPDVIAAYPITPATSIVEALASFCEQGLLKAEFIPTESEHSAMSALVGASATGARTFTASSSQGILLMHEILFAAAGMRLPIVMAVGNRAVNSPLNIWCEHTDSLAQRDTGWIQIYAENNQEVVDSLIMAYRVAEDKEVLTPAMVCLDGFFLTHTYEPVEIPEEGEIDDFLPPYEPSHAYLDVENPITQGPVVGPDFYTEVKYIQELGMKNSKKVMEKVHEEFLNCFGRKYGFIEEYKMEDADIAFFTIGSMSSTGKEAVDLLRDRGEKVGLIKLRVFRPIPDKEIIEVCKDLAGIAVFDRNFGFGSGGIIFSEIKSWLYKKKMHPAIQDFIIGLGGRDIRLEDFLNAYEIQKEATKKGEYQEIIWLQLKKEMVD
ncbi:MAG: pyruvate ferredoxin oxidoreductase [Candidatus Hydrothermarchaeota archaeon]